MGHEGIKEKGNGPSLLHRYLQLSQEEKEGE